MTTGSCSSRSAWSPKARPGCCRVRASTSSASRRRRRGKRLSAPVFLLIARLLFDKGVGEFVDAARMLKRVGIDARFQLLGFLDAQNRTAVPRALVEQWVSEGVIEYLGPQDDVRPFIAAADCVVLPSYREGTPRTLLEAAAMAKPLIATNVPGCREVVEDGVNGLLCEAADAGRSRRQDAAVHRDEPDRTPANGPAGQGEGRAAIRRGDRHRPLSRGDRRAPRRTESTRQVIGRWRREGHHSRRRLRHTALSGDAGDLQADAAGLRQADDLLSAGRADAGGHHARSSSSRRRAICRSSRRCWATAAISAFRSPMPSSRSRTALPRPSSSAATSSAMARRR